jgi:glycosyltransferase involved in cell wall biosynthesis
MASGDLWAGAEVQIAGLLKYLKRQEGILPSAIVLNPGRLADEIRNQRIDAEVIPERTTSFMATLRKATEFFRGRNVQIIHSHRYKENLLAAALAWRCGIPLQVRTRHGLSEPHHGRKSAKQALIQGLDRLTARWGTDRIVSVSSEMTNILSRHLDARKIVTIRNGIDLESASSKWTPPEAKEKLGIPGNCRVIGTAGRLEPVKRLDLFLEMAAVLSRSRPDARFVICGDGRQAAKLRALAQTLGIPDRVLFLGHRNDVLDVLRALDIMVLSSDHEGLPIVLLEAMALGVVVVARAVGGIPEVIRDGVNGVLVDSGDPAALADACSQILGNIAASQEMAEAARTLVASEFSAEHNAAQVRLLYNSLLGLS